MKQGMNFTDWSAEIERRSRAKRDFRADSQALSLAVLPEPDRPLEGGNGNGNGNGNEHDRTRLVVPVGDTPETFTVNSTAHGQLAARTGVPKKYYDRMLADSPELLADNVNHWLQASPEKRLVRTIDGRARAYLSDRYRILDNRDLLQAVAGVLGHRSDFTVASCNVSDDNLHFKIVFSSIEAEIRVGEPMRAGLYIGNSEVGSRSLQVFPYIVELACLNGMLVERIGKRKYHIGRAAGENDEAAYELYQDETLRADDKAFWLKVQDIIRAVATPATFEKVVAMVRDAEERKVGGQPPAVVSELGNRMGLLEAETTNVLTQFLTAGHMTQWGLAQAVTRASQDVSDYDRATALEAAGARVLELPPSDWRVISEAAA